MLAVSPNKRTESVFKVVALLCGIFLGGFYASFGHSVAKQWFSSSKSFNAGFKTIDQTTQAQEINETARFLVSDDTTIADDLAKKIRVLCWIHNNNPEKERIDAIKKTWGNRCTELIVIKNSGNNSTDMFNIPHDEIGNSNIENAYRFIHSKYATNFDWFLKTTGNSYVVMENLRFKLFSQDPGMPIGVGLALKNVQFNETYFSDKAGYALSRKALKNLIEGFDKGSNCSKVNQTYSDEVRIGICLNEMNVHFSKSNDSNNKQLFFDKHLDEYFLPNPIVKLPYPWYQDYKVNHNLDSASNYSIAFCDISWQQMFVMEFLIYQLRPYGIETETPE